MFNELLNFYRDYYGFSRIKRGKHFSAGTYELNNNILIVFSLIHYATYTYLNNYQAD